MDEFPRMLYRFPSDGRSPADLQDGRYDTLIVYSADEPVDGWHLTPGDARAAAEAPKVEQTVLDEHASRADLVAKAEELGIVFDGRISNTKLLALITARLNSMAESRSPLDGVGF